MRAPAALLLGPPQAVGTPCLSNPPPSALPARPPPSLSLPAPAATVDILSLQREATCMPGWAAYKAHMELGFRLGARQRCARCAAAAAAAAAAWHAVQSCPWACCAKLSLLCYG